ncbi:SLAM family member 5-like isoform X2 [Carassius carassius]|uniref:SLAM family member 5-like isoform X2 n=1 Tax=Carassius carassius TaxID=217509 RepID=UPI0028689A9C|nr:SLAM family member 5-like isoform X2 [Carassius carassius]
MALNHILRFLLFLLSFKTGFGAEISVFVQTGTSVHLDIQTQQLPEFDLLAWMNNKSEGIVRYISDTKRVTPHDSYKDRVVFNDVTFSLTLKNMQKNDSGLYRARISGSINIDLVSYRVSVIDSLEAPVLTVNSNWSSSDSCTVNFTCRAHELMINSSYQNNRCSPQEVTSQINTLILDCSEESIICNHSNPVSWNEDKINIKELCIYKENELNNDQTVSSLLWPVVCSVALCILICLLVFLYFKYKKGAQEEVVEGNTVYAQVEAEDQTREKTGNDRPITVYWTLGQHKKPTIPPETDHTVYSEVYKQPNEKLFAISADDT